MWFQLIIISIFSVKFSEQRRSILCYADAENTLVVPCPFGCVYKRIIEKFDWGGSYQVSYKVELGCDVSSVIPSIQYLQCDEREKNGSNYSFDYALRSLQWGSRLYVRKDCCFTNLCNRQKYFDQTSLIEHEDSFWNHCSKIFFDGVILSLAVFTLIIAVSFHFIFTIFDKMLSKSKIEESDYFSNIDSTIKAVGEFDIDSVVDTELHVTGLMNIAQTSEVLSLLPDDEKDNRGDSSSKSKSKSSEESTPATILKPVEIANPEATSNVKNVNFNKPLLAYTSGMGHKLLMTSRTTTSPFSLLYRLIEHGPYQYPFTPMELLQLFEETAYKFSEEPSLLKIDAPVTIISDIRGKYIELHRWLQLTGWPPKNQILFLGGMIHNDEPGSIECLALICSLKCRFPKHVFCLRGVPETTPFRMAPRFHPKISKAIQSCVSRMCTQIPFAAIVGKSILAVYSGFSPMVKDKSNVTNLLRPVQMDQLPGVVRNIIFNNPSCKVRMYRPNEESKGDLFGKEAVERACKTLGVNLIVRGHNVVKFGYLPCWKHRLINLWSATALGAEYGAVLSISSDLNITPIIMHSSSFLSECSSRTSLV